MEVVSFDGTEGDKFLEGIQILVVDDDETCLKVMQRVLTKCKYEVVGVTRATDALNILHERKGGFDLILADVHMPIMDGFELLAIVRRDFEIPVIMVSADNKMDLMAKGLQSGACSFCVKPVTMNYAENLWQYVFCKQRICQQRLVEEDSGSGKHASPRKEDGESSSVHVQSTKQHDKRLNDKGKRYEEVDDEDDDEDDEDSDDERVPPKKSRMVWTPSLHEKFVSAIKQIGIKKAVPKKILDIMNVRGVSRTNIASHLQKYRLYLKGSKESSQYGSKIWDRYPASYGPGLSQFCEQGGSSDSSLSQAKYGQSSRTILSQRNIQRQLMSTRLYAGQHCLTSVPSVENSSFQNPLYRQGPTNLPSPETSGFMNLSEQQGPPNLPSVEQPVFNYPAYGASSYKSNYVGLQLCEREGMVGLRQAGLGGGAISYPLTSNNMIESVTGKSSRNIFEAPGNVPNYDTQNINQITPIAPTTEFYINPDFFHTLAPVPVADPQQEDFLQATVPVPESKPLQQEGMELDSWSDLIMNNSTNDLSYLLSNAQYAQEEQGLDGLIMDPQFDVGELQFDDNYQPQMQGQS